MRRKKKADAEDEKKIEKSASILSRESERFTFDVVWNPIQGRASIWNIFYFLLSKNAWKVFLQFVKKRVNEFAVRHK